MCPIPILTSQPSNTDFEITNCVRKTHWEGASNKKSIRWIFCLRARVNDASDYQWGVRLSRGKKLRRRDLEADTKRMGYTWGQLVRVAQDTDTWKTLVDGLCSRLGWWAWWWWLKQSPELSTNLFIAVNVQVGFTFSFPLINMAC
jgi:hypothetical protein